jgi:DNA-binding CsgD family transcriptional regulator
MTEVIMTVPTVLGEDMLRALVQVIELGRHRPAAMPSALPWPVLTVLQELFVCRVLWFRDLDQRRLRWAFSQQLDGCVQRVGVDCVADPDDLEAWVECWRVGQPVRPDTLVIPMPCEPGRIRWLTAVRDPGDPFTEREQLIAGLLRPHLHDIWRQSRRAPARVPRLTPREWEILHLVGDGLSNAEIAKALFLAPATVRKHLEHVFDKVGVRSRSAAAATMMPHSPYAWPGGGVRAWALR